MRIRVNELTTNMIIGEDVFSETGLLILPKGFSISNVDHVISLLKKNNINKLKVITLDENELELKTDDAPPISVSRDEEVQIFVEEFNTIINNFQNEIEQSIIGNSEKEVLMQILEESLKIDNDKNTNIFQLLQKYKDEDDLTFVHCNSVSLVAYTIGKWLDLSERELEDLSIAGLLADVGKFRIPQEILQKNGPLTYEEFEKVKTHVDKSIDIVENYRFNDNIVNAVKFHHERCDGSGYPYGLKYEQIPYLARIIAVADMFVALTSKRPYRDKMTPFEAINILETEYMRKLDISILSEFIKRIAKKYINNPVVLSDESKGEILFINNLTPLRPIVKLENGELLDLSNEKNSEIKIKEFL